MLTGTHYLRSAAPTGSFDWATHGVLLVDPRDHWYGAKVIRTHDGRWAALAWNYVGDDGKFAGTLSDPMQIDWDDGPRVRHLPASRVPKERH